MSILATIEKLRDIGTFSDLDVHFTKLINTLSHETDEALLMGAVLASHFTTEGSSCVDLKQYAERLFPSIAQEGIETLSCPSLSHWLATLQNNHVVGQPGDYTPLILDKHRLYLYRYFYYEQQLAAKIGLLSQMSSQSINHNILEESLSRLFPNTLNHSQKIATRTAMLHHFCIISGGPGTGKTTTVVKILTGLLEQNPKLNIALAAPTGKAAVRLQEAVKQTLMYLNCAPAIKAAIPQETYTIHRLLGSRPTSPYFHQNADNLLPYDVIIVDEASMIDLALMAKLVQAIPKTARLILLGDKDQLASVETGTVLGDICEASINQGPGTRDRGPETREINTVSNHYSQATVKNNPFLQNRIVLLEKNYRFGEDSGIRALAQAVKQGQGEKALQILQSQNYPDVSWHSINPSNYLPSDLLEQIVVHFSACLENQSPVKILQQFDKFKVLSATRHGRYGIIQVNRQIETELSKKGLIQIGIRWYHGRPIMITRNDYRLSLFNGDVGIILGNMAGYQKLQAFFPSNEGQFRTLMPYRLPEHETVYAMTIHKSQGSEFDNVLMLLPDQISPLLTRELIYTGITRARQSVKIWGNEQIFLTACSEKIRRSSGLRDQLNHFQNEVI
jgi:exodeoxyribonuclease V alpha subunit